MTTSELKKLIAGFLLLAVAVTSSALFFFDTVVRSPARPTSEPLAQNSGPQAPENAFQEPVPVENGGLRPDYQPPQNLLADAFGTSTATNTLTARLVLALGDEMGRTNPNGPLMMNGQVGLTSPNIDAIVTSLTSDPSLSKVKIPDWEGEIVFRYQPRIIAGAAPSDIAAYKKALADFYERYLAAGAAAPDPTLLTAFDPTALPVQQALIDAQNIPTPEPFAKLQWNLIKVVAYQEEAIKLLQTATADPIGASVIMQVHEQKYFAALDALQKEAERAVARGLLPSGEDGLMALFHGFLGIRTAYAAGFPVMDLTKLARKIWEYVKKVLLNILQDVLVHKLVMQTINWIQGGGKPQFVTNWKGFLMDSLKTAAGIAIDRTYPQLCTSFAPLIRVAVIPVDPSRDFDALPSCTIDRVVQNVQNFAQSFENGGWVAYGAAMEPSNNFLGSIIQSKMLTDLEAAKAKRAAEADAKSGKGAKSQQDCVKETDSPRSQCIDNTYQMCVDQSLSNEECIEQLDQLCSGLSSEGKCTEFKNTTPGDMLMGSLSDTTRSSIERVVNAKDLVALINTLINAAMSKLVKLGQTAVSKGLLGINPAEPYVAPPQGGGGGQNNTMPTLPEIPTDTSTIGAPAPTGPGTYQGAIDTAVASVIAGDSGTLFDKATVDPYGNYQVRPGQGTAYHEAVVAALKAAGYVAVNAYSEEIALRRPGDTFDENYDIMLTHQDGSEWTRPPKYMGSNSPPADTAGL